MPIPTLFAGLLNAHGQLGPAEIPAKSRWMAKDVLRKAALLGVTLERPASHPFKPLLSLRISSLDMSEGTRRRLIDGLFRATWAQTADVSDPTVVARVADEAGLDGEQAVREASSEAIKARLREQTQAAVEVGVFGVPTFVVASELFWGYDDLPMLERYLRGEDPLDRKKLEALDRHSPKRATQTSRRVVGLRRYQSSLPGSPLNGPTMADVIQPP